MPSVTRSKHGSWRVNYSESAATKYKKQHVASADAGHFLNSIREWSQTVAVKLDVEGFEYTLLPHLLQGSRSVICSLDLLVVEWHRHVAWHTTSNITKELQNPSCNVSVLHWQ